MTVFLQLCSTWLPETAIDDGNELGTTPGGVGQGDYHDVWAGNPGGPGGTCQGQWICGLREVKDGREEVVKENWGLASV